MGSGAAAPRLTARAGEDEEWLTGRVGMDYWMHIGILFSCQEIYSIVRKSIRLTVPFSLPCRDIIPISECTHGHGSDGLIWHLLPASRLYQT